MMLAPTLSPALAWSRTNDPFTNLRDESSFRCGGDRQGDAVECKSLGGSPNVVIHGMPSLGGLAVARYPVEVGAAGTYSCESGAAAVWCTNAENGQWLSFYGASVPGRLEITVTLAN